MFYYQAPDDSIHALDSEEHAHLLPDGCVEITKEEAEEILQPPAPTAEELLELRTRNRAAAYREESDPLFFKWQRGEATEQQWLDKVEEIKARYP